MQYIGKHAAGLLFNRITYVLQTGLDSTVTWNNEFHLWCYHHQINMIYITGNC